MSVEEITGRTHGCGRTVKCWTPGEAGFAWRDVDACLAGLVNALNAAGALTRACCCGHGVAPGSVILHDGTDIAVPVCPHPGARVENGKAVGG